MGKIIDGFIFNHEVVRVHHYFSSTILLESSQQIFSCSSCRLGIRAPIVVLESRLAQPYLWRMQRVCAVPVSFWRLFSATDGSVLDQRTAEFASRRTRGSEVGGRRAPSYRLPQ